MSDERLNLTEYDFRVQDEGTLVLLRPQNDAARGWIDEYLYGQEDRPMWWGDGVVIEHRMARAILDALDVEGFVIG